MKHILLYTFILLAITADAQEKPDFGKVTADSSFDRDKWGHSMLKLFKPVDPDFTTICNSKNELEIRLLVSTMPRINRTLSILAFNKGEWSIKKYTDKKGLYGRELNYTVLKINDDDKPVFNHELNNFFDTLKVNDIFLLPDQQELNVDVIAHDGAGFILSFKAGNSFRSYSFNNPVTYEKAYPNIKEFKEYTTIVNIIEGLVE